MEQISLFKEEKELERLNDQVVCRLILDGIYPFYTTSGTFKYLIGKGNNIIGTGKKDDFEKHFNGVIHYKGEGRLNAEELAQCKKYGVLEVRKVKRVNWDEQFNDVDAAGRNYSDADPGL